MIEWLRALPPPFRFALYVAGVVALFFVAVGLGAAVAVITGWQFGGVATGSAGGNAFEGSNLETTGTASVAEYTATEQYNGSKKPADDKPDEASFVHRATAENSRGDYTYLDDPLINNDPDAIVLVEPTREQKDIGSYRHNIGVWYTPRAHKWAIFNQDLAAVPAGATFEVEVPRASAAFVHHADPSNSDGNYTYLDNELTNGEPDAKLSVTQNWNPGGGSGVYNDHPIGTVYDAKVEKWAIYNRDGASMPSGAAFNFAVSAGNNGSVE